MLRAALTIAIAAALAIPATASASAPITWQHKALALAQTVWHPACGPLTVTYGDPGDANAVDAEGLRTTQAVGWTIIGSCDINLNQAVRWDTMGFPVYCMIVLHEAGHSAGMPDVSSGPSIMNNSDRTITHTSGVVYTRHGEKHISKWAGVDQRCVPKPAA